ncbi:MAG: type I restriction enzyme HsdR N-terminal domain-containing protein [Bacteroidales bacterium]|jgi:hypothetical protein|nr:type I restriction enzyme HsdR N-terminal domain-containing protein [Bacteroidales bacterium]
MDLKDQIKQLSERIEKLKNNIGTEEATKNAFIMPFIQALGYDVFNPLEVVPEFTCDIGTKKGEKIDYAILKDEKPVILMECKHWMQELDLHDNQLLRYFNVSTAKFGVLTNGIIYRFYTDLKENNKMDEKPFLEVNLTDLKEQHIEELKKFHKSYFDVESIINSASELKYTGEIKAILKREFETPSVEFVKMIAREIYDGKITEKILAQFTELTKHSIVVYINDMITERLKSAIEKQEKAKEPTEEAKSTPITKELPEGIVAINEDGTITTKEEIEGFYIVKSILRSHIDQKRIVHRDFQRFFSILIDDSQRQCPCRLYLNNPEKKQIEIQNEDRSYTKYDIDSVDDIFKYSNEFSIAIQKYVK